MATTRIRRTFRYSSASDGEESDGGRDEMDEEEQENLLNDLHEQSTTSNRRYTLAFTFLPLLATPIFLVTMIFPSTPSTRPSSRTPRFQPQISPARIRLLSLLALTSLLATAFGLYFLSTPIIPAKNSARKIPSDHTPQSLRSSHTRSTPANTPTATSIWSSYRRAAGDYLTYLEGRLDDIRVSLDPDGPLLRILPWLNIVISVLLALSAWLLLSRSGSSADSIDHGFSGEQTIRREGQELGGFAWTLLIPGFMAVSAAVVSKIMTDERRELDRLRGLRYTLKGA